MAITCELAQRTTIRAFRVAQKVLIVAEGELPDPSYDAKVSQRPERIFPPWYQVLQCPQVGVFPDVIVPYRVSLTVDHPEDQPTVRVFHADGEDDVTIEACGDELSAYSEIIADGRGAGAPPDGADEATGFSKKLSFDEAFADAITRLAPIEADHPDMLETVRVVEIGGLFGGIAGFHDLYVKVSRTHD